VRPKGSPITLDFWDINKATLFVDKNNVVVEVPYAIRDEPTKKE